MVVFITIKEMSYLVVDLFDNLVGPFCTYFHDVKFFGCAVCFESAKA